MKKLALTIAIALGTAFGAMAQDGQWWGNGGGLFQKGETTQTGYGEWSEDLASTWSLRTGGLMPGLPSHGEETNQDAPLGSGIVLLTAFGAAYLVGKKKNRKE